MFTLHEYEKALKHRHYALKLDMVKAYDRLGWAYLEAIMLKQGFTDRMDVIVMNLVKSVSYSILLNGKKFEDFKSSRGTRQEGPISSYMFLLPAEGSSGFLKSIDQLSQIGGIQVASSAPCINHLLFA